MRIESLLNMTISRKGYLREVMELAVKAEARRLEVGELEDAAAKSS